MQKTNGANGLCLTCNNAPGCYYRARRGPALFCEMFDDYVLPFVRVGSHVTPPGLDSHIAPGSASEDGGAHLGLCMNCRHRAACMHPRPNGGVWHCEDYD